MAPILKGGSSEVSTRKRRPSATSSSTSASTSSAKKVATTSSASSSAKKTSPVKVDYGKMEERQAAERSGEKDSAVFRETCGKMKDILVAVYEEKSAGGAASSLAELKGQFLGHFLTLKKLNRLDKLRTRQVREATAEAKSRVDNFNLQLQNLLYEVLHLRKEVTKCLQYRSADEDIELVPVEQFYADAPESMANEEKTKGCEHAQRLARLEYENLQRKGQMSDFKRLEMHKSCLEVHIGKKRENLANLKPQLSAILTASKPVQSYLGLPLDEERDQLELARFLPPPLFILFSEMRAYGKACDPLLTVKITGDLEEAKSAYASDLHERLAQSGEEKDEDDPAKDDDEDDSDSKAKGKKADGGKAARAERLKRLTAAHPLSVSAEIILKCDGGDSTVQLTFRYLTRIEVVVTDVNLALSQDAKSSLGEKEMLQAKSLFSHLMVTPDDGVKCPNPTAVYTFKKFGVDDGRNAFADVGSMYQWAQNLCGLKFPENANEELRVAPDKTVCQSVVGQVADAIRQRLTARLALQKEISALQKSKHISVDLAVPETLASQFPAKLSSHIRAWTPVDWEQYAALDVTKHLVETGAVDGSDFLFRLQVNRDTGASLIALVAVKPDHPTSPPVFCLNLHWNGEHNINNSENVRALESEVNLGFLYLFDDEKAWKSERYQILTLQIKKLMSCFDVMLEAWQMQGDQDKADFARQNLFLHNIRGRRRKLPLKYNPQLKMYSQL